ncbi:MAG: hypothetical protein QOG72_2044, partial [Sphingomonadales bacterium]|nr:hypothetical protein [Sphingomonadales bacterium]
LNAICEALSCQPGDILGFAPDEAADGGQGEVPERAQGASR